MKHYRTLAALLTTAALTLTACTSGSEADSSAPSDATSTESTPTTSPSEAPSEEASATPTKKPVPTALATTFPKHNRSLKQLRLNWVRVDVLPGWTGEVRRSGVAHIKLVHKASKTQVFFVTEPDVSLPGAEIGPANAGKCGAYVQIYGRDWFQPGWTEGPHSTVFPSRGVGYSCGLRGVPSNPAERRISPRWEMPITSLALNNGQHVGQLVFTPLRGNKKQLKIAGAQAAIMLQQAASIWYGKLAW